MLRRYGRMTPILIAAAFAAANCPGDQTSEAAVCRALAAQETKDFGRSAAEFEAAAGQAAPGDPAAEKDTPITEQ